MLACTVRFLALQARAAVGGLLREVVEGLLGEFADAFPGLDRRARLEVYEARAAIYLRLLAEPARVYAVIREQVSDWLARHGMADLPQPVDRLLDLDAWLCPRTGEERLFEARAAFDVAQVLDSLDAMRLPPATAFSATQRSYRFRSPGGLGVVLLSPDGGRWLRSRFEVETAVPRLRARDTPPFTWRMHRTEWRYASRQAAVESEDPSSTTISSKSWKLCARIDSRHSARKRP